VYNHRDQGLSRCRYRLSAARRNLYAVEGRGSGELLFAGRDATETVL
jgi:hypothetical protein